MAERNNDSGIRRPVPLGDIEIGRDKNLREALEDDFFNSIIATVDGANDFRVQRSLLKLAADQLPNRSSGPFHNAGSNVGFGPHGPQIRQASRASLVHPRGKISRQVVPKVAFILSFGEVVSRARGPVAAEASRPVRDIATPRILVWINFRRVGIRRPPISRSQEWAAGLSRTNQLLSMGACKFTPAATKSKSAYKPFSAMAKARSMARALFSDSSNSSAGTESATMPAPAWR